MQVRVLNETFTLHLAPRTKECRPRGFEERKGEGEGGREDQEEGEEEEMVVHERTRRVIESS